MFGRNNDGIRHCSKCGATDHDRRNHNKTMRERKEALERTKQGITYFPSREKTRSTSGPDIRTGYSNLFLAYSDLEIPSDYAEEIVVSTVSMNLTDEEREILREIEDRIKLARSRVRIEEKRYLEGDEYVEYIEFRRTRIDTNPDTNPRYTSGINSYGVEPALGFGENIGYPGDSGIILLHKDDKGHIEERHSIVSIDMIGESLSDPKACIWDPRPESKKGKAFELVGCSPTAARDIGIEHIGMMGAIQGGSIIILTSYPVYTDYAATQDPRARRAIPTNREIIRQYREGRAQPYLRCRGCHRISVPPPEDAIQGCCNPICLRLSKEKH